MPPDKRNGPPGPSQPQDAATDTSRRQATGAAAEYTDLLLAEATAHHRADAAVLDATDIGTHAIEYGLHGWPVFPLRGKHPAIRGGRGVLDATTDITQIAQWWGGRYAGCNIGGRIADAMILLDIDPRHGGLETLARWKPSTGRCRSP